MIRWAPLVGVWVALGCADAGRGPTFPTSETFPDFARQPPTFAADSTVTVSPTTEGEAGASDLTTREAIRAVVPLDPEAAKDLVSHFFIAVLLESGRDLYPLFASQAWVVSEGSRQPAQAVWRARLSQLDYTSLSGRIVAPPQTLRTYTYASAERAKRDGVPAPQSVQEVVVVARPALSWGGKTRLFGDELAFRLRPKQSDPGYEIAEIVEDFRLP